MTTVTRTAFAILVAAGVAAGPAFAQQPAGGNNGLENRISTLHDQMHITPAQEPKWQAVAKVMRDNAEASRSLVMQKRKNESSLTAVADLDAYAEIAEAHAKHVRRLAKVFGEFYATLSDDQKKAADELFREHKRQAEPAGGSAQ